MLVSFNLVETSFNGGRMPEAERGEATISGLQSFLSLES